MEVPSGWSAAEADGQLTAASPDGSVAIVISVIEAKDAKRGVTGLDKDLAGVFPGVALAKHKAAEVNGLKGYMRRGTAELNGAPVELGILVLKAPNGKIFMVLALGVVGMYEQYGDQMNAALASISRVRLALPAAFYQELSDPDAQKVVEAVINAIDANDSAALSKYIAKDFSYFGKSMKASTVKSKAKKKVAKWLKMPDAPWHWEFMAGPAFTVKRGSGYGQNWVIEFYDEGVADENPTGPRWRVSGIMMVDEGEP